MKKLIVVLCTEIIMNMNSCVLAYNSDTEVVKQIGLYALIALGLGFLMAFLVAMDKKSKLSNVHTANTAMDYLKSDAIHLSIKDDHYLRTSHIRTPINPEGRRGKGGPFGGPGGFGGPQGPGGIGTRPF